MSSTLPPDSGSLRGAAPLWGAGSGTSGAADSGSQTPAPSGGRLGLEADVELVERTRQQIRRLTQEIGRLAQSDLGLEAFWEGFLTRVTQALASQGGACWSRDESGSWRLDYQTQFPAELLTAEGAIHLPHLAMLDRHWKRAEPGLVAPRSGGSKPEEFENPTPWLTILAPVRVGDEVVALVEVFQRTGSGPATQRGYLRFLVQMTEHAAGFLRAHRLRTLRERQGWLERIDRFVAEVHRRVDLEPTQFAIVNEGRIVLEMDRVALAIVHGRRCEISAVSGLDTVERRSADLRTLSRLASVVCRAREPLWFSGDEQDLPPQIEEPLHEYLDQAHVKGIGLIPLFSPGEREDDAEDPGAPIGCLVIEQMSKPIDLVRDPVRAQAIAIHASQALANALALDAMPFSGLLRRWGRWRRQGDGGQALTWGLVAAAIAVTLASLFVIPYPFRIGSPGQLMPVERAEVFAPMDGVITDLLVGNSPSEPIAAGATLARLTNETLQDEINQLEGRERQLSQRSTTLQRQRVENYDRLTLVEEQQLMGELESTQTELMAVGRSLVLKRSELRLLEIPAPRSGIVTDDRLQERLHRRPVQRGQALMTLVDPAGPWEVELFLPEKRLWELREAAEASEQPLRVSFELATRPGEAFVGTIRSIDSHALVRPGEGNTVLVRVSIDRDSIPDEVRVSGARVVAKIEAGHRSIAYVLLHDFWQMLRSRVFFPLT